MPRTFMCSTALALVLASSAGAVTPEEVWDNWQAMAASSGQELTVGEVARKGDRLEVSDVVMTFVDELGGSATASLDLLTFTDLGDGRVRVGLPESYPLAFAFPETGEGPTSMRLTVSQPELSVIAAGSAADTGYEIAAPTVTITLEELVDPQGESVTAEMVLRDLAGRYAVMRDGERTNLDSSFTAAELALNVADDRVDGSGAGTITLTATGVSGATKGAFLTAEVMANVAAALDAGFTMDSTLAFEALTVNGEGTDVNGPVRVTGSSGPANLALAINRERLSYETSFETVALGWTSPDPFLPAASLALGELGYSLQMPMQKTDMPQDFALVTRLVDFTLSDDLWGIFDPGAVLSREPATVVLDVKGQGLWFADPMDPDSGLQDMEAPGELTALDLTLALAKAAGAEVSATGALTFDKTDMTSFAGVPAPSGSFDVTIKGVNALVDNLIYLGFLTTDDALGFRMMLGIFARPGTEPDALTSLIEFRDGGVFANGQQLQ